MLETILFIIAAVFAAIWFFKIIEEWKYFDSIEDGTDPTEHDEWP